MGHRLCRSAASAIPTTLLQLNTLTNTEIQKYKKGRKLKDEKSKIEKILNAFATQYIQLCNSKQCYSKCVHLDFLCSIQCICICI